MTADPRAILTRPAPPPDTTVAYGPHPDQVADLRQPAPWPGPPRPLVIVVHGGFWRSEYDRSHTGPLAADLAARGYPVAQLEYRRTGAPGGGWPGTLDDVSAGLAALPELVAAAIPAVADGGKPILLGHSAGGQLALYGAATHPSRVGGVLALAPVADLVQAYQLDLDGGAVAALLGGGPAEVPDRYAAADPRSRVPIETRTVILHGVRDEQVPIGLSRDFVAANRAAGMETTLIEIPECEHFGLIAPDTTAWTIVTRALKSLHTDH